MKNEKLKRLKKDLNKEIKKTKRITKQKFKKILKSRIHYFFLGGFLIFLLEWLLTIFLTEVFSINVRISYFVSLALGLYFLFIFHKKITFKIKKKANMRNVEKFLTTYFISYGLNWIITSILIMWINYIFLIPIVTLGMGLLSYLLNRYWVFS